MVPLFKTMTYRPRKKVESLGDQHTGLAAESVDEAFLEDSTSNTWVEE